MKYIELQAAFELEINKIDSNLEKPKSYDIEYWLNRGLEEFYKTRYTEFEQNQKRIDDLRTLIDTKYYVLDENMWNILTEKHGNIEAENDGSFVQEVIPNDKIQPSTQNKFYVYLPHNYMFLLGDTVGIVPVNEADIKCAQRDLEGNVIPTYGDTIEATIETVDALLRNTLSEHRFKYLKARPIKTIENNKIVLISDGNYKIQNYKITYLRRPNNINIHNNPYDEYTDMPSHTHSEIIKLAVSMYLENQTDPRYRSYSAE